MWNLLLAFVVLVFLTSCSSTSLGPGEHKAVFGGLKMRGIISIPNGKREKFPAVLILGGSGQIKRKEEDPNSPFKKLADYLSARGFVTFRYHKRGSGMNTTKASFKDVKFWDNYSDAREALAFLFYHSKVDRKRVFVLGQSMGGVRAMRLASENPPLKGVVLVNTPGLSMKDLQAEQLYYYYRHAIKMEKKQALKRVRRHSRMLEQIRRGTFKCENYKRACSQNYIDGQHLSYWEEATRIPTKRYLKKIRQKVFIGQGHADWIVSTRHAAFNAKVLRDSGNKRVSLQYIKNMDHFMHLVPSKKASMRYVLKKAKGQKIALPVHKMFFETLADWLKK